MFHILVKYFKNSQLDFPPICRYYWFSNIYVLQGSVAT